MIDVQRMVKDIKRMAEETNTMITEIEGSILIASTNNRTMNATNITQISEDFQYLVQSNMDKQAFQVQRMLANKLDHYKERGNKYVDDNIWEIQELYIEEEKKEGKVEDKEVILVRPYEVSMITSLSLKTSFIMDEVENLIKYMKFVWSPTQTRLFKPPLHYQSLKSRDEQDSAF